MGFLSGYAGRHAKSKAGDAASGPVPCAACGVTFPSDNETCPECGSPAEPVGKTGVRYDPAGAERARKMVACWVLTQAQDRGRASADDPVTEHEKILDVLSDLVHYCNREGLSLPLIADEAASTVNGPPEDAP